MIALLLLFGFLPYEAQDDQGALAPHLSRDTATQWRLAAQPRWRAFRERWGGPWVARWDERTGAPRFLYAPGVPVARMDALVDDVARLAGVDPGELVLDRVTRRGEDRLVRYARRWQGALVVGDQVGVVAKGGRIAGVWVQLSPTPRDAPREGEVVLPLPLRRGTVSTGIHPVLATRHEDGPFVSWRDRAGEEVLRVDTRSFGTVEVSHYERTVGDAMATDPARDVTVSDGTSSEVTDDAGMHGLSGDLTVSLTGPQFTITSNMASISVSGSDETTLMGGTDLTHASAVALHHFEVVWDWLEARWPSHPWLGEHVPVAVDLTSGACNAYYTSGTVNFYQGYPGYCHNLGEVADVLYHEVGHGIHHYILAMGTFASDVSEGSADYVAATINDDPEVGVNAWWDGTYVREIETDKRYPDDITGESHNDGLVWASFMWNLREDWQAAYGEDTGAELADGLLLGALEYGPSLTDLYEAVILADDDDGDLSNGTPHACELVTLLEAHGIGPGPIGVVEIDHEPLEAQSSFATSYEVTFDVYAPTADCADFDEDSVQLWYTTGTPELPEGDDTGGSALESWAGWNAVTLGQAGTTWTGAIPRQLPGTKVSYFIQASSTDGAQTVTTHDGDPTRLSSFWVGEREALWCEDFESGAPGWTHGAGMPWTPDSSGLFTDQWAYAAPAGGAFDPDSVWEGATIAITAPGEEYLHDNQQYLASPVVDLSADGQMLLLSYRRWLTVEDSIYDQARLVVNGLVAWQNPSTEGGTDHTLDTRWTLHDVELEPFLDESGALEVAWTLTSDPGLEFGGWALDEVCVVRLGDIPGHYQVRDLAATDDEEVVTVTWSNPFIDPLGATALVRSARGWPAGPDDGVLLELDDAPTYGEAHSFVDTTARPGRRYHYALFAGLEGKGGEIDWYTDVEEGRNADVGGVPGPPADTADPGDPDDTGTRDDTGSPDAGQDTALVTEEPEGKEPRGCGCASAPATPGPGALLLLPGLLVARRRRQA